MTKTSSSAAGVSLRVCPRQTGTLQQEEMGAGEVEGLSRGGGKRKVFSRGTDKGEPHAEARATSAAILFMLLLSQVLIVPPCITFNYQPGLNRRSPPRKPASGLPEHLVNKAR